MAAVYSDRIRSLVPTLSKIRHADSCIAVTIGRASSPRTRRTVGLWPGTGAAPSPRPSSSIDLDPKETASRIRARLLGFAGATHGRRLLAERFSSSYLRHRAQFGFGHLAIRYGSSSESELPALLRRRRLRMTFARTIARAEQRTAARVVAATGSVTGSGLEASSISQELADLTSNNLTMPRIHRKQSYQRITTPEQVNSDVFRVQRHSVRVSLAWRQSPAPM
mmetsp:Transcript_61377/g.181457  ORF Transcript_61377/g.181457 Transcript_61377/m.181457 type:complete len:223 (-) Transcript_61377:1-669(-)